MISRPARLSFNCWHTLGATAVLLVCVWAVFGRAANAEFLQWDDDINILENTHLNRLSGENVQWMFTDVAHMRRYVPLTWLSWAIERATFGLTQHSAHLGNILFHSLNTVLVFFLLRRVLSLTSIGPSRTRETTGCNFAAAAGALLWSLHPMRVEPVAWASGRIYCLATFFLLLAILAYLESAAAPAASVRRRIALGVSLLAYGLSMLTYPLGLTLVGALVVIDWHVLGRFRQSPHGWRDRGIWGEKILFGAIALAVGAVTLWARLHTTGTWQPPVSLAEFGLLPRLAQAGYILAYYVWRPLLPFDLSPVYATLFQFSATDVPFLLSAAGVAATTAVTWWQRRRWPGLFAIWLCHLVLLIPVLGLTEHPHYSNDRYTYVAGLPWFTGIAALVLAAWSSLRIRTWTIACVACACVALGTLSVAQVRIWHDSETLFRYMLTKLGDSNYRYDILMRLGEVLRLKGNAIEAQACFQQSLQINPKADYAYNGLGALYEEHGNADAAIQCYQTSIRLVPNRPLIHFRLGVVLYRANRVPEAIASFEHALQLKPDYPEARDALSQLRRE